jgi:Cu(I)/Ag(I) efflux system periplasmic protein CusF
MENDMTRIAILITVLAAGTAFAFPAGADDGHMRHATKAGNSAAASAAWTEGEVRKVDKAAGKLTIKHGPMPKFDMPPMTMAYRVKDKTMLDQLKPGDKIKFDVDGVGGEFTVLRLEKVK